MKIENLKKHSAIPLVGIYFLYKKNQLVYIGQSTDILLRIRNHFKEKDFDNYSYFECEPSQLNEIERLFIEKYTPLLNKCLNIKERKERKKQKHLTVCNKENNRLRKYYSIFDIKKKYPHLNIDELSECFENKGKKKIEDHLLIIY